MASSAKKASPKRARVPAKPPPSTGIFLVKSEPFVYSFDQLTADKKTSWDGVRNFEARNTLRAMKKGDTLLFYHSNEGKEIVGIARVSKEAYADPTTDEDWSAVEIAPVKKLKTPVTLATIKAHPVLSKMALVKRSRISVVPVTANELALVLELAKTTL
jgi:predicted RNA-binding protein with PUA-like domain